MGKHCRFAMSICDNEMQYSELYKKHRMWIEISSYIINPILKDRKQQLKKAFILLLRPPCLASLQRLPVFNKINRNQIT